MTSAQGWPVWQGTFLPFGEEYSPQISSNHYKFSGKERDIESGLDYFGARYYGSALGRFITSDWSAVPVPVPYADFSDPQSLNQYTYVRDVPTTRIDPDGHMPILTLDDAWAGLKEGVKELGRAIGHFATSLPPPHPMGMLPPPVCGCNVPQNNKENNNSNSKENNSNSNSKN